MTVTLAVADVMCFSYHEIKGHQKWARLQAGVRDVFEKKLDCPKKGYKIPLFNE